MEQASLRSLSSAAVAVGVTGVVSISVPLMLISGLGAGRAHHDGSPSGPAATSTAVHCAVQPCAPISVVTVAVRAP